MAILVPNFYKGTPGSFEGLRAWAGAHPVQEGVVHGPSPNNTPLLVAPRGAGANMSVDIKAGSGWVEGDDYVGQGMYHIYNDATYNLSMPMNFTGNPRVDTVWVKVHDEVDGGDAYSGAEFGVSQGTPTAGASRTNLVNPGTVPPTAMRLANVVVPHAAASIVAADIVDRRPWAFGAYFFGQYTGGDFTLSATTQLVEVRAAELTRRMEIRNRMHIMLSATVDYPTQTNTPYSNPNSWVPYVNGVAADYLGISTNSLRSHNVKTFAKRWPVHHHWLIQNSNPDESMIVSMRFGVNADSVTVKASTQTPLQVIYQEIVPNGMFF